MFSKIFYESKPDGTEIKLREPYCGMQFTPRTLKDCRSVTHLNLYTSYEGKSLKPPKKGKNSKTASYRCTDENCCYRVYLNRTIPGDTHTTW